MHLFHLVTSSKIQSRQTSRWCIPNYWQPTNSTSSLLWNQQSHKCCISSKNTWLDGPAVPSDMSATCTVWGCIVMLKDMLQQIMCFSHWSSTWEAIVSTVMRKWQMTFVNGCECNSLTLDMMKILKSRQDGRNTSKCSELFRKIMVLQWNIWSTLDIQITCHLLLRTRNCQLLSILQIYWSLKYWTKILLYINQARICIKY